MEFLRADAERVARLRLWRRFRDRLANGKLKRCVSGLRRRTSYFEAAAQSLSFVFRLFGLWKRGIRNAATIRLVHTEICIKGLPPIFHGYTILHLSDLHIDMVPELADRAAEAVAGLTCDLAVITGDYQAHYGSTVQHLGEPLSKVFSRLNAADGIVGILGNHDDAAIVDLLQAQDVTILVNETIAFRRCGETIYVSGVDDVFHHWTPHARNELASAPRDGVRIALVHTSDLATYAAECGYALYLTGHTHGGQICLPGQIPVLTMGMDRSRAAGLWRIGTMTGHTSRGIGVSCLPLRFNCPAEITLITLLRG